MMRQADFTRARLRPAAHEGDARDRVMRRAKRAFTDKPGAAWQQAGHRVHGGDFERFVERERRKNPRHPSRHHRLAGTRRSNQQQVMPARTGNLDGPSRQELTVDVGKVQRMALEKGGRHCDRCRHGVVQRADGFDQGPDREDVEPANNRRLAGIGARQKNAGESLTPCRGRDGQHAPRGLDGAVERDLANDDDVGDGAALDDALGGQDAKRNGQVERRSGLSHVGRCQVDGDAMWGEFEPRVANRAAHAVAAFAHARVGEADHRESRQPERDVDFDVDRTGVDTEHGGRTKGGEHTHDTARRRTCVPRKVSADLRGWARGGWQKLPGQFARAV